ncbi:MAG TPA: methyltransferase domain-containing protein [Gaiellaceae bacterium]|nr:methyltransferase domain-containing protein [Gaiellaceae bacterium]
MSWRWEVAEADHAIQNPLSPEKVRLVGDHLRLGPGSRVLDVGCGKGGPALLLAREFGCRVLGVELREAFADEARRRAREEGLEELVEVRTADAANLPLQPEEWDAALCLGATFVWGTIADAAAALAPAVRRGGGVAVGEPFWRAWPLPADVDAEGYAPLAGTVERFTSAGLALTGLVASSEDDWDRYESLHWRAVEEWLAANPDGDGADAFRAQHDRFRREYLATRRAFLGWAVFVGRRV